MTAPEAFNPIPARDHRGFQRRRGLDAVTMLTVYIALVCLVPSNLAISALGTLGRPSLLWGLFLALWWVTHNVQAHGRAVVPPPQPVRLALAALIVVALVSFAVAVLRGQPADQVTPAINALIRFVSYGGVALVAMDGIRTMRDLRTLVARLVLLVGVVALLGLVQTGTGMSIVDEISIPGFNRTEEGGIQVRGSFVRAAGTAVHPLEYATVLAICLPLALAYAMVGEHSKRNGLFHLRLWLPLLVIASATLVSASRSALLGFGVGLIAMLPALPRRARGYTLLATAVLVAAVIVVFPGMFGTMMSMFTGVSTEPSAISRTTGLARAPGFIAVSPLVGAGLGTFLPRYYIFDNQWVLLAVEIGLLGVLAFASLLLTAMWSAWAARRASAEHDVLQFGQGLVAACLTAAVLMIGFDALSFPMSASILFLVIGLCGALRAVADADRWILASLPDSSPGGQARAAG
ncbi:O-antigen ligase domain-containing protein [Agromyces intestinalis]|uniref:O-antigen ligase domain-containing protein n=1 Tax=Agromyces intestinalis TaxID=2592652 RepID=A0A5C1YIU3_9MICO|nr:O-antigen ligase family protein [Agromyces intestinalis]QEO15039.1 O-antigen ligase domain-containing protein [Agromyces intestinalis]